MLGSFFPFLFGNTKQNLTRMDGYVTGFREYRLVNDSFVMGGYVTHSVATFTELLLFGYVHEGMWHVYWYKFHG